MNRLHHHARWIAMLTGALLIAAGGCGEKKGGLSTGAGQSQKPSAAAAGQAAASEKPAQKAAAVDLRTAYAWQKRPWTELAQRFNFAESGVGRLPSGWKAAATNPKGELAQWQIVEDSTAASGKALAITKINDTSEGVFNLCFSPISDFRNGNIQIMVKAVSGKIDQGGGLVWRAKDAKNYYVLRYNPLEANYRLYKVIEGKRTLLTEAKDIPIPAGKWFTIRVETHGAGIEAFIDGKEVIEADDSSLSEPGAVGLWTKADAASAFADVIIGKGVVNTRFGVRLETDPPLKR